MNRTSKLLLVLLVVMIGGFGVYLLMNPEYRGPEYLEDPIQTDVDDYVIEYVDKEGNLVDMTLFAQYSGYFNVQSVQNYQTDGASSVSPKDVVLSWGRMVEDEVDRHIKYSQSNRWYYFRYDSGMSLDQDYIISHSANTHLIPADEQVADDIKEIGEHDYIYLEGYLAVVHFEYSNWSSSNTRLDTGDGSCEIVYVTDVEIY